MTEQVYNVNLSTATPANNQGLTSTITNKSSVSELLNAGIETLSSSSLSTTNNSSSIILTNNSITNINQCESKINRIQMLRMLAIKTAAILDWNLLLFEKEYVNNVIIIFNLN